MTHGECMRFLVAQMAARGEPSLPKEWTKICDRSAGGSTLHEYRHPRLGVFAVDAGGECPHLLQGQDFAAPTPPGSPGHAAGVAGASDLLKHLRAIIDEHNRQRMDGGVEDTTSPVETVMRTHEYKAFAGYLPFVSSFCFPEDTYGNGEMEKASLDEPLRGTDFCLLFEDREHILESIEDGLAELLWPLLPPGLDMCDESHFMADEACGDTARQMIDRLLGMGFAHHREDCAAVRLLSPASPRNRPGR